MIIDVIAGARPNFMKIAALFAVTGEYPRLRLRLVHTGQHYDLNMSDVFMQQLNLPEPVCHLGVGSGSHAVQTAEIMRGYERWVLPNRPDLCLVVGDVNSTIACALVAAKAGISVGHVEAGLRSFDRAMPEEINRILTDSISDELFVSEPSGAINLKREGHPDESIHMVGNTMIDTLLRMLPTAKELRMCRSLGLEENSYGYVTIHRPSNVDDDIVLGKIVEQMQWLAAQLPVVFPVHPRTLRRLQSTGWAQKLASLPQFRQIEPVGYLESLSLIHDARIVVTDSGGIQEETTALGVPCLTLRESTERPITVEKGTNAIIGGDWGLFQDKVQQIARSAKEHQPVSISHWDGQAGRRILQIIDAR